MPYYRFEDAPESLKVDVAIVGGGIAGLYCAWRLLTTREKLRVAVIERLNRTGGRLNSDIVTIKEGEDVRIEQGGMRFNYGMVEMMRLTKALDLCDQIVEFPMASNVDGENTNRYYVRRRRFTFHAADEGGNQVWGRLYDLRESEKGLSPGALIREVFEEVMKANQATIQDGRDRSPEFWAKFRNEFLWRGVRLRDWSLWDLMGNMGYSVACRQMLADVSGFVGLFKGPGNAGGTLQILADFPSDPRFFTFQKGFATLPNEIEKRLRAGDFEDRVHFLLNTNVQRVDRDSGGSLCLRTRHTPETESAMTHIPEGDGKTVCADRLIVAAAARGARDLVASSPALLGHRNGPRLYQAITSVEGMRLMKINLYFTRPWWALGDSVKPPVQFGPNFTDMPANSVYPFYSLPAHMRLLAGISAEEESGIRDAAAALTVYCDFHNTEYWRKLQETGEMFTSPLQEKENARRPQRIYPASKEVVAAARSQLRLIFGTEDVPEPLLTSYRLWDGQLGFENAYHLWKAGTDDIAVRDFLVEPIEGVHFCNSAYSDKQAWVDGSLRSSNAVLRQLGVPPLEDEPCEPPPRTEAYAEGERLAGLWGG